MFDNDIDVCVVSEMHLKPDMPDVMIDIFNYTIFRRYRNWCGFDLRQKRGLAVYIRKNLSVSEYVWCSNVFEFICLFVQYPISLITLGNCARHENEIMSAEN